MPALKQIRYRKVKSFENGRTVPLTQSLHQYTFLERIWKQVANIWKIVTIYDKLKQGYLCFYVNEAMC